MISRHARAATLLLLAATMPLANAASLPPWVAQLPGVPVPPQGPKTGAVLLRAESVLTVRPDGQMVRLDRRAFRILHGDGGLDTVEAPFSDDSPLLSLRAWSVPEAGKPYEVKEKEAMVTVAGDPNDAQLVTDRRVKVLRIPFAKPGTIVAYEIEQQQPPYLPFDEWDIQSGLPTVESSYSLKLPEGWSYQTSWVNSKEHAPQVIGGREFHWSQKDVDGVPWEASMPPVRSVASRMIVALVPPAGRTVGGFRSWNDVGLWYLDLARGRAEPTADIRAKVQQLTASAKTSAERIEALARYVQNEIRYVGIQLGVGALRPHAASEVFSRGYGDCKDKANLLVAMLKEAGIESHYVLINHERGHVVASSPAQFGFDHEILAIRLPDDPALAALPGVATHPRHGKLLFFDPTDTFVPFGRLPAGLQGNFGLLVAPEGGELVPLPLSSPEANGVSRTATLTLSEAGLLQGAVIERWDGVAAVNERGNFQAVDRETDRIKALEARLSRSLGVFEISKAAVRGSAAPDRPLEWHYTLHAPEYAKVLGDLVLLRPRVIGSFSSTLLESTATRHHSIEFTVPSRSVDEFEVALPAGLRVDELPSKVDEDLGFVTYHSNVQVVNDRTLRYRRTFELREVSVPASKAEDLKRLYRIIDADERASVVLKRDAARLTAAH